MKKNIDFVCPGFPKGGTTWLYERLSELPEFSMTPQKEIHWFDRSSKYQSSKNLENTIFKNRVKDRLKTKWLIKAISHTAMKFLRFDIQGVKFYRKWYFSNFNNEWYLSLFNYGSGITGDITPTYCLLDDTDVEEMSSVLPKGIKLIFVLRNPVDRAWSHFRMSMRKRNKLKLDNYTEDEIRLVKSKMNFSSRNSIIRWDLKITDLVPCRCGDDGAECYPCRLERLQAMYGMEKRENEKPRGVE